MQNTVNPYATFKRFTEICFRVLNVNLHGCMIISACTVRNCAQVLVFEHSILVNVSNFEKVANA